MYNKTPLNSINFDTKLPHFYYFFIIISQLQLPKHKKVHTIHFVSCIDTIVELH